MRVGVDLDGVIYDFNRDMLEWLRYGGADIELVPKDEQGQPLTWKWYEALGLSGNEFHRQLLKGVMAGRIFTGEPLPGAVDALKSLDYAGHTIHVITHRPESARELTAEWLHQWGIPCHTLSFVLDKTSVSTDVFIEDRLENWRALTDAGVSCYLVRRPWNHVEEGRPWPREYVDSISEFAYRILNQEPAPAATWDEILFGPRPRTEEVRVVSQTGGEKGTKLARFDLIPAGPLQELAEHYGRGSLKYADRNWERGYPWSLSFAAAQRHGWEFWGGEDLDPETRSKHAIAAAWHWLAIAEFMDSHPDFDDRPSRATQQKEHETDG